VVSNQHIDVDYCLLAKEILSAALSKMLENGEREMKGVFE
jgi:hypothetical protein